MTEHEKTVRYEVNTEPQSTEVNPLKVSQILENAGFSPATNWTLKSENPPHDYDSNYDQDVTIHENQRFDALHKGPTPTS